MEGECKQVFSGARGTSSYQYCSLQVSKSVMTVSGLIIRES